MKFVIRGGITLLDPEDCERFARWRWRVDPNGYVARSASRYVREIKATVSETRMLHREVMGLVRGDGLEVDHRNGKPLDNQRHNLLVVTRGQQMQNCRSHRDSSSRHRGVSWHTARGAWRAVVWFDGRQRFVGYFDDEAEAARSASEARMLYMTHSNEERHAWR